MLDLATFLGSSQRRALRALGMRFENVVRVADLLGRQEKPIEFVDTIADISCSEWQDQRSGLSRSVVSGPIQLFELKEGFVELRSGAVFLASGELIAESTVWHPLHFLMNSPRLPRRGSIEFLKNYSVIPSASFYHFLVEDLPRLSWVVQRYPSRRLVAGVDPPAYARESAALMAGSLSFTSASHIRVSRYPFISYPPESGGWPTKEAIDAVRSLGFSSSRPSKRRSGEKIYISRLQDSRSPANEREVIDLAVRHGYTPVAAGELSLLEQIRLFSTSKKILGVHGAGLTNSVWMSSGAEVVEIMDPSYYNACYQWLSRMLELQHQTLVNSDDRPNVVNLQRLEAML